MPLFSDVYVAVVLIFGIVLAAACYAVRRLETRPARTASVLAALAFLVGALVPVVRILTESAAPPAEVVAPAAPTTTVSPAASPASEPTVPGSAVLPPTAAGK
jgi:predicted PurR-regulated permease PerM